MSTVLPNAEAVGSGGLVSMGAALAPSQLCTMQLLPARSVGHHVASAEVSWCTIFSVLRWNCTDTCFSSCEQAAEPFLAWKEKHKDIYYALATDGASSVSSHPQHG